jgi:hypothetical protein
MVQACRAASVAPAACDRQDSGDGQILLLPAGVDESTVLPGVVLGLLTALHRVNHPVGEGGRIRLRVSMGQGAVQVGATGFVAPAVVTVCRLLDSDELRSALSAGPASDAAFIVTADLYQDMFAQGYGGLPARDFHSVHISRPAKGFSADAWIQVPGPQRLLPQIPGYPHATATELRRRQSSRGGALTGLGGAAALAWVVFGADHGTHPAQEHTHPAQEYMYSAEEYTHSAEEYTHSAEEFLPESHATPHDAYDAYHDAVGHDEYAEDHTHPEHDTY